MSDKINNQDSNDDFASLFGENTAKPDHDSPSTTTSAPSAPQEASPPQTSGVPTPPPVQYNPYQSQAPRPQNPQAPQTPPTSPQSFRPQQQNVNPQQQFQTPPNNQPNQASQNNQPNQNRPPNAYNQQYNQPNQYNAYNQAPPQAPQGFNQNQYPPNPPVYPNQMPPPMSLYRPKASGSSFLMAAGVLRIIGASGTILMGLLFALAGDIFAEALREAGLSSTYSSSISGFFVVLFLIIATFPMVQGIIYVKFSNRLDKASLCNVFAIIDLVFLSFTLIGAMFSKTSSFFVLAPTAVIPILAFIGARRNKREDEYIGFQPPMPPPSNYNNFQQ